MKTGHQGGFVLSRKAISWLEEVGLPNKTFCSERETHIGSERIRLCLQKSNVYSGIDARFHRAFLPRNVRKTKIKLILIWNTVIGKDIAIMAAALKLLSSEV
jgi:hypothetical protein